MNKKIYPLMSGGIDSTIATLKRMSQRDFDEMQPIFIDYGQKACEQEWNAVCEVSKKLAKIAKEIGITFHHPKRIDLSCSSENRGRIFQWSRSKLITGSPDGDPYVENRNMILLSVATSFVESQIRSSEKGIIITGFRDEYPDTKGEFVVLFNCLLTFLFSEHGKSIEIATPIIDYGPFGKKEMVKDFQRYEDIIELTWSCYNPDPETGKPCQICEACRDRKQALCQ